MRRSSGVALHFALGLCLVWTSTLARAATENNTPTDYMRSIAEIYTLDKDLIGSGTIVSSSGLILTAKHILVDAELPNDGAYSYRTTVKISFADRKEFLRAELLAVHPHLDLAVLQLRSDTDPGWPALPIMTNSNGVAKGDDVVLVGHKKRLKENPTGGELHIERRARIDELERDGHLVMNRKVDRGTSGGPALSKNKVLGVIIGTDFLEKSVVTPLWSALDYFRLLGVEFSVDGYAERKDSITELASRVRVYESILIQMLLDLRWTASIEMKLASGEFSAGALLMTFATKLGAQQIKQARLKIAIVPTFKAEEYERLSPKERNGFSQRGWLSFPDTEILLPHLDREVTTLLHEAYGGLGVQSKHLDGFEMKLRIDSIKGSGLIAEFEELPPIHVCFSLKFDERKSSNGVLIFRGNGKPCRGEYEFAYLDQFLPK